MNRAEKILIENIEILHNLANTLLEREILDSEEIDKIIKGEKLPPNGQKEEVHQIKTDTVDLSLRAKEIKKAVEELKKAELEKSATEKKEEKQQDFD